MLRRLSLTFMLCLATLAAQAQDEDLEYKLDMGVAAGAAIPIGDTSGSMGPAGGIVVRRIFNPRMALKTSLAAMKQGGETDGYFPTDAYTPGTEGGKPASQKWKRCVLDLGCMYEMNFWGYGAGPSYKGNSRITPYIAAGAGFTLAVGNGASAAAALNIPLAMGLKYKLNPRLNLELEWSVHFTTTDKIDDTPTGLKLNDPYGIESGMFKNKDCYTMVRMALTYDMCPKLRKCNN